jgi:hypothetical protein
MAITFVGAGPVNTNTFVNSFVSYPSGIVVGDLLLYVYTGNNSPTNVQGGHWVTFAAQGSDENIFVAAKTVTAYDINFPQISGFGTNTTAQIVLAYRGTSSFDAAAFVTGSSTSVTTSPITTTRFANEYVLSIFANPSGVNTWTPPAGATTIVTSDSTVSAYGLLIADELQAVAGATTVRTATLASASDWSTLTITLKEPQTFYIDPNSGNDANDGLTFGTALKNISGISRSTKGVGGGDTVRIKESPMYNTGVNATWTSVTSRGVNQFGTFPISNASNAIPIVITTPAHGYSTGDVVQISGATGNLAANGIFKITVIDSTNFSLDDSSGNGAWASGGIVSPIFCRTIKTATPLVQPIASFAPLNTVSLGTRLAWVGSANVTVALVATFGKGAYYDSFSIATAFTTGKIAYYTLPATLDLSAYQQLSLFIRQAVGTLGGLTIRLCSDTTGDTVVNSFLIPTTSSTTPWCPFTFNNGSALGSSIRSISISRTASSGTQIFFLNSIVAVKSPSSVDALSNTSLITKNNATEGAFAVGGFGGSDGTIVFLENSPTGVELTTTGGAYHGTTETVPLYRIEPFNPYTLNSAALPSSTLAINPYCNIQSNTFGIEGAQLVFSGGWDSTNMSTRTGATYFDNQNGLSSGLQHQTAFAGYYTTIQRINTSRCNTGALFSSTIIGAQIKNGNYTATGASGIQAGSTSSLGFEIVDCTISNTVTTNVTFTNINADFFVQPFTRFLISGCTFSGATTNNLAASTSNNSSGFLDIVNSSFNTAASTGILFSFPNIGDITNCNINYVGSVGIQTYCMSGSIENLNVILSPNFSTNIILNLNTSLAPATKSYNTKVNNLSVSGPITPWTQGTTQYTSIFGGGEFTVTDTDFFTGLFTFGSAAFLSPMTNVYFYNCSNITYIDWFFSPNVFIGISKPAVFSQNENGTIGNNIIYTPSSVVYGQTAVRHSASGYCWQANVFQPIYSNQLYPDFLKVASIACNANVPVTVSAWVRRDSTEGVIQLVCPGGQPYGPVLDVVATISAPINTWEQISITFTPTQDYVYDIYAYYYLEYTALGSLNAFIDDLTVQQ